MLADRISEGLTFDDVLLIPGASRVLPKDVEVSTKLTVGIDLKIPFLSAAMDTVTEARTAIAIAQEGGIGIIHKNWSIDLQAKEVQRVKKFESGVVTEPLTISPNITLGELTKLREHHGISGFPVVDGLKLVGIVTHRDIQFEGDDTKLVSEVMTSSDCLVTA